MVEWPRCKSAVIPQPLIRRTSATNPNCVAAGQQQQQCSVTGGEPWGGHGRAACATRSVHGFMGFGKNERHSTRSIALKEREAARRYWPNAIPQSTTHNTNQLRKYSYIRPPAADHVVSTRIRTRPLTPLRPQRAAGLVVLVLTPMAV